MSTLFRLTQVDLLQLEFVKGVSNLHYLAMFLGETPDKPPFFFWANISMVDAKNHPHHPRGAAVSQRIPIEGLKPGGSMAAPCDWIIGRSGKIWDNSGRCGRYIIDIIHYLWFMGNIWDNTNKNEGDSLLLIYNGICNQRL